MYRGSFCAFDFTNLILFSRRTVEDETLTYTDTAPRAYTLGERKSIFFFMRLVQGKPPLWTSQYYALVSSQALHIIFIFIFL